MQVFKRHMDALLEPLFASLACDHQLSRAAAGKCVGRLRDFVGPGIWAGHLTDDQAAAMAHSPDVPAPAGDLFNISALSFSFPFSGDPSLEAPSLATAFRLTKLRSKVPSLFLSGIWQREHLHVTTVIKGAILYQVYLHIAMTVAQKFNVWGLSAGAFSKVGVPARPFQATGAQAGMAPTRAPWASASIPPLERPAVKPGFGAQFPGR